MNDLINYCSEFSFHNDIKDFLYFADSDLKNYEYNDIMKDLNIQIVVGNMDSGINLFSDEEPSAIYTSYKIMKKPAYIKGHKVPHYPRYRALNPFQRYEYLEFLCNPYEKCDISYVYLLFYGLERRLSEGHEEVIPVMEKLGAAHGEQFDHAVKRTIRRYQLWKSNKIYPTNARVFYNYTLRIGCYDDALQ